MPKRKPMSNVKNRFCQAKHDVIDPQDFKLPLKTPLATKPKTWSLGSGFKDPAKAKKKGGPSAVDEGRRASSSVTRSRSGFTRMNVHVDHEKGDDNTIHANKSRAGSIPGSRQPMHITKPTCHLLSRNDEHQSPTNPKATGGVNPKFADLPSMQGAKGSQPFRGDCSWSLPKASTLEQIPVAKEREDIMAMAAARPTKRGREVRQLQGRRRIDSRGTTSSAPVRSNESSLSLSTVSGKLITSGNSSHPSWTTDTQDEHHLATQTRSHLCIHAGGPSERDARSGNLFTSQAGDDFAFRTPIQDKCMTIVDIDA